MLLAVVAVAVTVATAGAAVAALSPTIGSVGAGIGAFLGVGGATTGLGAAALAGVGAAAGAAGSIASQAVGVATGIQEKFSWKGVALAGISGGVGGGVAGAVARGAIGNAATQGVALATGLQRKFDWAGVAAGGAAGGAIGAVRLGGFGGSLLSGAAGAIAGGAARGLIDGTSFGDNVLATLPDVIGSTIGNAIAGAFAGGGGASASRGEDYKSGAFQVAANDASVQLPGQPEVTSDVVAYGPGVTITGRRPGFLERLWNGAVDLASEAGHWVRSAFSDNRLAIRISFRQPSLSVAVAGTPILRADRTGLYLGGGKVVLPDHASLGGRNGITATVSGPNAGLTIGGDRGIVASNSGVSGGWGDGGFTGGGGGTFGGAGASGDGMWGPVSTHGSASTSLSAPTNRLTLTAPSLGIAASVSLGMGATQAKGTNTKIYSDGSLRTPDGKFASIRGMAVPGTASAGRYADFLSSNGIDVVGRELEVNGPLGVRRYDIVTRNADGSLHGLEIKSGGATRSLYQDFSDRYINRFGATGRGRINGQTVTGNSVVYLPGDY